MTSLTNSNKEYSFFSFMLFFVLSLNFAFIVKGKSHSANLVPVQFYFSSSNPGTIELSVDFIEELKATNGKRYVELDEAISAIQKKLDLLILSISLEAEKSNPRTSHSTKEIKSIPDPTAIDKRYRNLFQSFRSGNLNFLGEVVGSRIKKELKKNRNLFPRFLEPTSLFVENLWKKSIERAYFLENEKQTTVAPFKDSKLKYFHYKVENGKLSIEFRRVLSSVTMDELNLGTHTNKLLLPQTSTHMWLSLLNFFNGVENLQVLNIHKGVMLNTLDYFPTTLNVEPNPKYPMLTSSSPFNYMKLVHTSSLIDPQIKSFLTQFHSTARVFRYKSKLQEMLKEAKEKLLSNVNTCQKIQVLQLKTLWSELLLQLEKRTTTYQFFYVLNDLYKQIHEHSFIHWKPLLNSFSPLHQYFSFKSAAVLFSNDFVQHSGIIPMRIYGDLNLGMKIETVKNHGFTLRYVSSFKKESDNQCPVGLRQTVCQTILSFFRNLDNFLHRFYLYSLVDIVDNEIRIVKFLDESSYQKIKALVTNL